MFDVLFKYWPFFATLALLIMLSIYILYNYFSAKEFDQRSNEIIKRVKVLYKIPIKNKLANLEKMARYSDVYAKGYKIWSAKYRDIIENELHGVTLWLDHIKEAREDRDYHRAQGLIAELLPKLEVLELKVNSLNDELEKSREVEKLQKKELERNRERWTKLKNAYSTSRALLHDFHKYLDSVVISIDDKFKLCNKYINEGKASDARKIITSIEDQLIEFGKAIETIPDITSLCKDVIPNSLARLEERVKYGRSNSISFIKIQFEKTSHDIRTDCALVLEYIENDKINEAIELCNIIHHDQRNLEAKIEAEFKAQIAISEFYPTVRARFEELANIISEIEPEIKKAVETSKLSNEDLEIVSSLKGAFENVCNKADKLELALRDKLKHSMVELLSGVEYLDKLISETKLIFDRQITVLKTADISSNRASKELREQNLALIQLENELITTKYKIKKAEDIKQITMIKKRLDKLTDDIKNTDVNVSLINKELTKTRDEIGVLTQYISNKLKTAKLSEKAIVYANRYIASDSTMPKVITAAQVRFENGDYDECLSGLLTKFKKLNIDVSAELGGEISD